MPAPTACLTNTAWPRERVLFLLAGTATLLSAALSAAVSPLFLLMTAAVGLNQLLQVRQVPRLVSGRPAARPTIRLTRPSGPFGGRGRRPAATLATAGAEHRPRSPRQRRGLQEATRPHRVSGRTRVRGGRIRLGRAASSERDARVVGVEQEVAPAAQAGAEPPKPGRGGRCAGRVLQGRGHAGVLRSSGLLSVLHPPPGGTRADQTRQRLSSTTVMDMASRQRQISALLPLDPYTHLVWHAAAIAGAEAGRGPEHTHPAETLNGRPDAVGHCRSDSA